MLWCQRCKKRARSVQQLECERSEADGSSYIPFPNTMRHKTLDIYNPLTIHFYPYPFICTTEVRHPPTTLQRGFVRHSSQWSTTHSTATRCWASCGRADRLLRTKIWRAGRCQLASQCQSQRCCRPQRAGIAAVGAQQPPPTLVSECAHDPLVRFDTVSPMATSAVCKQRRWCQVIVSWSLCICMTFGVRPCCVTSR